MSRSNPQTDEIINPNKNWFQWDGDSGKGLKRYDKETKKNEIIPLPFRFMVLDKLITVVGYNESKGMGYWANEVRDLKKDKLVVRTKDGIEAEGTWAEVDAKLSSQGLKFCQSVYIAFYDENKNLVLGNIKMSGAAVGNWFTFCKENNVMEIGVTIKESKKSKKGKVEYFEPVFVPMSIKEETNQAAIELDKELQTYLKAYLERNSTTVSSQASQATQSENNAVKAEETTHKTKEEIIEEGQAIMDQNDDLPF